ncbi:cupredoxin domain-containing protein [Cohnella soli]|uniref:Cupredoxin domain-containing protein n=1 Tax=Cohnella soli TaxID=425005 RepID=A0ABW0HUY8_9BACL
MKKMTKKSTLFLAITALAATMALSACGSKNNDSAPSSPAASPSASTEASAPAAGGETKEITIKASNFQFDQQEIKAKVGDTLVITLQNDNGNHGIEFADFGVKIKNGETTTIKLDKAGTFEFNCSIMCGSGHDNMTGKIIVE